MVKLYYMANDQMSTWSGLALDLALSIVSYHQTSQLAQWQIKVTAFCAKRPRLDPSLYYLL